MMTDAQIKQYVDAMYTDLLGENNVEPKTTKVSRVGLLDKLQFGLDRLRSGRMTSEYYLGSPDRRPAVRRESHE